jgi:tetratricopeptide (TPR) repeat protein
MGNDIPPDSILTQSLERRIQRNPQKFLEKVAVRKVDELFADSHVNQQVASCATSFDCQEFIKNEIIFKNFDRLCDSATTSADAQMQYANILYLLNEFEKALLLLDKLMTGRRDFNNTILKADCLRRLKRFDQAESIYETAFELTHLTTNKALALYKRSKLVTEAHDTVRFGDALDWAKEAMELHNTEADFVHPVENIIVYLTIELAPLERIELEMQKMMTIYSISATRGEKIVQSITNVTKRKKLESTLQSYAV